MHYRPATRADVPALAAMNAELIVDEGHRNRMSLAELEVRMAGWLQGEYRAVLIESTDQNATAAGYALFRDDPDYVYLRQFYVRPEQRRRGVGRAAIAWLRANAWGGRRVRVEVLVGNEAAISFWRAVGFSDYCLTLESPELANRR